MMRLFFAACGAPDFAALNPGYGLMLVDGLKALVS
jgi:hypothetical protein